MSFELLYSYSLQCYLDYLILILFHIYFGFKFQMPEILSSDTIITTILNYLNEVLVVLVMNLIIDLS